jgi:hypothetical protein
MVRFGNGNDMKCGKVKENNSEIAVGFTKTFFFAASS